MSCNVGLPVVSYAVFISRIVSYATLKYAHSRMPVVGRSCWWGGYGEGIVVVG
jgi:hypothetical protein